MAGSSDCIMSLSRCARLSVKTMENVASGTALNRLLTSGSADFCIVFLAVLHLAPRARARRVSAADRPAAGDSDKKNMGGALQRGWLANLGFDEPMIAAFARSFDS